MNRRIISIFGVPLNYVLSIKFDAKNVSSRTDATFEIFVVCFFLVV